MFAQWKVLHVDAVESEGALFCRALEHAHFAGRCESVRSFDEAKLNLDRTLYFPQLFSRPDIIVIDGRPGCDTPVLEFVHWVRIQPQLHVTPAIVFVKGEWSLAAQERAQQEGVTELIGWPDTFEGLVEELRALLDRCASRCAERKSLSEIESGRPGHGSSQSIVRGGRRILLLKSETP